MHESRVRKVVQSPLGLSLRISLRIQITHRSSLVMGNQVDRAGYVSGVVAIDRRCAALMAGYRGWWQPARSGRLFSRPASDRLFSVRLGCHFPWLG